jgi:hypothetical protein
MSASNYTKPAELCVFTNKGSNPRMTKLFTVMDGIFKKNGSSQMFVGTCEIKEITSLDELHALMNGLSSDQALTYGIPKNGKAMQDVGMVPWAKAHDGFARGKDFMEFRKGKPGVMYIDHDPDPAGKSVTADELSKLLGKIDPAFADVQMLSRSSSSNGIYSGKELMTTHAGTHIYFMVDNASKIPEIMKIIHVKAWLLGYGFIALSEAGSLLNRSVFDVAVAQAERLDYAAAPLMMEPLTRSETKPKAMNKKGSKVLKTSAVTPLRNDEMLRFEDLVNAAKTKIEPKAAKVRKKRIKQIVDEQCGPGASRKEKEAVRKAFVLALDYKILDGKFNITSNEGKKTTVLSVLSRPQAYHGLSIPDPIFTKYGNDKAIIYSDQARPVIHSFAHGEHIYQLIDMNHWPELIPLGVDLLPVPNFDYSMLPNGFDDWVKNEAARQETTPDFIAVSAMVSLATVIGKKIGIFPKANDDWLVTVNLWGKLVGLPSAQKSPSMSSGMSPLNALAADARQRYTDACATYAVKQVTGEETIAVAKQAIKTAIKSKKDGVLAVAEQTLEAANKSNPCKPVERRYIVHNATVEKLGELLNENTNGLLQVCDELSGLIKRLEQHDKAMDRGFMLQAFDGGGTYSYDTISRGSLFIENVCMSLLGAMTPSALATMLDSALNNGLNADGMFQRFQLAVYPDPIKNWKPADLAPDHNAREKVDEIFKRLNDEDRELDDYGKPAGVRFDKDAQKVFDDWRLRHESMARAGDIHDAQSSHFLKYRSLFPSLALIINECDVGHYLPVTVESARKAEAWCDYLTEHALRIYGSAISPELRNAKLILENCGRFLDGFTARDVSRARLAGMRKTDVVKLALNELVESGHLKAIESLPGIHGGRPSTQYHWNPGLFMDSKKAA